MNSLDTKLRPTPDKRMASFLGFANMASTQVFAIMPPIAGREWIKQEKRLSPCTFRQVGWRYRPNKITCQQNRPSSALAFLQHAEILFSSGLRPCDVSYSGCLPIWCFKIPWLYHVFPDLFSKNPLTNPWLHTAAQDVSQVELLCANANMSSAWRSGGPMLHHLTLPKK